MTQAQIPPRMSARGPMPDGHWIVAEPSPRWVRNFFGGETIANSRHVMLFRENRVLPVYYFPKQDVRMDFLQPTGEKTHDDRKGDAERFSVSAGGRVAESAAWRFTQPLEEWPEITDHVAFTWAALDKWIGKNLVWSYPEPIPEAPKIRGLLCFFNERVDAIYVDGEEQAKPVNRWSQPVD